MTELEHVSVEKDDGTAIVAIDRQDRLNALNYKVLQELEAVFTGLAQDENLRGVILIGRGSKAFVAGADIEELADLNRQSWRSQSAEGQRIFTLIENFHTPVLAAVNGYALGGGCELALACHLRVASSNAKFGFPEVGLGIIPGFGGTVRLSRVIGFGRAIEMVLTGDMITAGRAEQFGLISAVFEPDELLSRSKDFLGSITRHSPQAIQKAIQSLYFAQDSRALESFMMENDLFGQLLGTEEMKEGVSAFLEKRKPVFKGV
jgi:enoyl-CoA hydratase|tara:strand:- start:487 stop:1272 length:786 start_codon:yes stop_codon:yes gene_type:complete